MPGAQSLKVFFASFTDCLSTPRADDFGVTQRFLQSIPSVTWCASELNWKFVSRRDLSAILSSPVFTIGICLSQCRGPRSSVE